MAYAGSFHIRIWQLIWYCVICLFGTLGNSLIIYLATVAKKGGIDRKAPFNIYLVALAVTDFLVCLSSLPTYILSTNIFYHPSNEGGQWMCKLLTGYFIPFWFMDVSVFLLAALAIERWRVIVKPYAKLRRPKLRSTLLVITMVTLLGIITQAPILYAAHYVGSKMADIGNVCSYTHQDLTSKLLHYNQLLLETIIPTLIFFVCFYQMYKTLSKRKQTLRTQLTAYQQTSISTEKQPTSSNNNEKKIEHKNCVQRQKSLKIHFSGLQEKINMQCSSLKRFVKRPQPTVSPLQQQTHALKRTKQTINSMLLVVVSFIVCVFINEILFLLTKQVLNITNLQWNSEIYQISVMLRFTNSCINPLIYGLKSKVFRDRLKETLRLSRKPRGLSETRFEEALKHGRSLSVFYVSSSSVKDGLEETKFNFLKN
ncbi:5-hydroxytryptamine receptor 1F-like [Clytia hemisphaerica]|uniref:5-hydroxytryptamine receptor 1F-like n=1 Tax=Clytia hemisphaerica TaxID=252671 RepID=UPI0034D58FD0